MQIEFEMVLVLYWLLEMNYLYRIFSIRRLINKFIKLFYPPLALFEWWIIAFQSVFILLETNETNMQREKEVFGAAVAVNSDYNRKFNNRKDFA